MKASRITQSRAVAGSRLSLRRRLHMEKSAPAGTTQLVITRELLGCVLHERQATQHIGRRSTQYAVRIGEPLRMATVGSCTQALDDLHYRRCQTTVTQLR